MESFLTCSSGTGAFPEQAQSSSLAAGKCSPAWQESILKAKVHPAFDASWYQQNTPVPARLQLPAAAELLPFPSSGCMGSPRGPV